MRFKEIKYYAIGYISPPHINLATDEVEASNVITRIHHNIYQIMHYKHHQYTCQITYTTAKCKYQLQRPSQPEPPPIPPFTRENIIEFIFHHVQHNEQKQHQHIPNSIKL